MKSKNVDCEVEELNKRFNELEINYKNLRKQYRQENLKLKERVVQLEQRNIQQEKKLSFLNVDQAKSRKGSHLTAPTRQQHHQAKDSFCHGDIVKVTNNYNNQYGAIGKIYSITKAQVHFTDIRTGVSITRAFKNVKILKLSERERNNLLNRK